MDADRILADIASAQHGVVSRRQLLEPCVPRHVIEHRLAKGLLLTVDAGVYRMCSAHATWLQRIMAATLACGPGAVASHRPGAFLPGLSGIDPRVEVSVAHERAPRPAKIAIHRLRYLSPADVEVRDGIPRTRAPATILGLAAVVPVRLLESALDDALVRGLVSCAQLQRRLDGARKRGRRGTAALHELLAARADGPRWTQSEFERRLLALLRRIGLALPKTGKACPVRLEAGR